MTSIRGFADIGDPGAPIGSPEWCKYAHDGLRFKKRDTHSAVSSFKYMLLEFKNEQRWKQILDNNGNPFRSWQHYVEHEEPKGLGMPLASAKLVMEELDDSRLLGDVLTARANPVRPTAGAPPQVERDPNASRRH